jgi:hypothetical protein
MEILREYIRELLTESAIHPSIEKYIKIAKNEGMWITLEGSSNGGVVYIQNREMHYGAVTWRAPTKRDGPCLGKAIIVQSEAHAGYGPLLYDIAIEASGGLAPDRNTVSLEARRVWQYYDNRRPDVVKDQLDDMFNRLTPEEQDNCDSISVMDDDDARSHEDSALSKAYRKAGTPVIDKLKEMGMIDIK